MKKGLVYQSGTHFGDVGVANLINQLKKLALVLRKLGSACLLLAVVVAIYIYFPLMYVQVSYRFKGSWTQLVVPKTDIEQVGEIASENSPESQEYRIQIPKIGAESLVIRDVDVSNKKEYLAALKMGVAEAKGLSHPGEMGTTYLFAHSVESPLDFARYNAVFYLLDKLENGDQIYIQYGAKTHEYRMVSREILPVSDTRYLVPQKREEVLILQTCFPPGTTWKRLFVKAVRVRS